MAVMVDMSLTTLTALLLLLSTVVFMVLRRLCRRRQPNLPPGPAGWPVVGNLVQIARAGRPFMDTVKELHQQYGPIFTLRMGGRTLVVVCSARLAHEALIQKGQFFASRPREYPTKSVFSCNKFTVNSATYGPVWRSLRRNLVSEMLAPSRVKEFRPVRRRSLDQLVDRLRHEAARNPDALVSVLANVRFTVFCILLSMCFGLDLPESDIVRVDDVLKRVLFAIEPRLDDFMPLLRPLFAARWRETMKVRREQLGLILPMVQKRRQILGEKSLSSPAEKRNVVAYVDTLFELQVEGRKDAPNDEELVTLCSEFVNGGTDTTAAAVEWAVIHLVADPKVQEKVAEDVLGATDGGKRAVEEEDVEKMDYLNSFVKEVLRKHPPTYFLLTHAVTEATTLGGYDIPADISVEFYSPAVSEDPKLWRSPAMFMPERFLGEEDADMTGVKEVKMMPFGAGRRICPGLSLGTLHISLLVARMVQEFRWLPPPGCNQVDMAEKYAFTVVAKNPIQAVIEPRRG
ncbi:unnamed protein product [Victoria cruziana]